MELKEGMKVRVKKYINRPVFWNSEGKMDKWMGRIVTIKTIDGNRVSIYEDAGENVALEGQGWAWKAGDFLPVEFTKSDLKDGMMLEDASGNKWLWLYGERRGLYEWVSDLPEKFKDEADHLPEFEIVKVGYPSGSGPIETLLAGDFGEVIWDKKWETGNVKEISIEEAAAILKEKYPEYDQVKIKA